MRRLSTAAALLAAGALLSIDVPAVHADNDVTPRFGPVPEALGVFDSVDSGRPHEPGSAMVDGKLVFAADGGDGGDEGNEVWVTDGTPDGTRLLRDVHAGEGDSDPTSFVAFRGLVWFNADHPSLGEEWWVTDGTPAGTRVFADVTAGPSGTQPDDPVVVGDRMYFQGWSGEAGYELMVTDGTIEGTRLAVDAFPGPESGFPGEITTYGSRVVYSARVGEGIRKPFVTDGTQAGTVRLDAEPMNVDLRPESITVAGDRIFFTNAEPGVGGRELWVSRGVPGDARPVKDINPGADGSFPGELTVVRGRLYFVAFQPATGVEVWTSDGTAGGTQVLRDIGPPVGEPGAPGLLRETGGLLHFRADDGVHGDEPWVSDGSAAGTRLVADLRAGPAGSKPYPLASIDGSHLFTAGPESGGYEPWVTDGTPAGTRMLADLAPGAASSNPWEIGVLGKTLVFATEPRNEDPTTLHAVTIPTSRTTAQRKKSYSHQAARRRRVVLRVQVAATAPLSGTVTLTRRGRVVGSAELVGGNARVRITTRLKPGRHRIVVSYAGSVDAQPSSTRVVVRVRPKRGRG